MIKSPQNPKKDMVSLMLGLSMWKSGNLADAHKEFTRLVNSAPGTPYETMANRYLTEIELSKSL